MSEHDEEGFWALIKLRFSGVDMALRYNPKVKESRESVSKAIDVLKDTLGSFTAGEYLDTDGNAYAITGGEDGIME